MANSQEVLWLLQAQTGDRDALDKLLQAIQVRLYCYLLSLVHDKKEKSCVPFLLRKSEPAPLSVPV